MDRRKLPDLVLRERSLINYDMEKISESLDGRMPSAWGLGFLDRWIPAVSVAASIAGANGSRLLALLESARKVLMDEAAMSTAEHVNWIDQVHEELDEFIGPLQSSLLDNSRVALEHAVLARADSSWKEGLRRVPLDEILSLPEVRKYFPENPRASFVPDELCRCLNELKDDDMLTQHDINIRQGADGYWTGSLGNNPAISITQLGREEIERVKVGDTRVMEQQRGNSMPLADGMARDGLLVNPTAFEVPIDMSHSESGLLVAVMIPFKREFDSVYQSIKNACEKLGLTVRKADDMWNHQTIIQEIFTLLCKADIVIVDLSGANPSVMYETGIAHTLGKVVVPLAQSIDSDVPFDMRHHRVLKYVYNEQGLDELTRGLGEKLRQCSEKIQGKNVE